MAYGNDVRLTLTSHILLHANRLVSPRGAVTPLGFRQCPCSETPFRVGLVMTAVRLTFISPIDPAEPEFLRTLSWLLDRTIVIYVSCLRNANYTSFTSTADSCCTSHAPLVRQSLPSTLCPWGKALAALLQLMVRRSSDGIRACGVHR
jgi:hypothetical protein